MRTYSPKAREVVREWRVIDANGLVLGRLATTVASLLRGKHRPGFTPHLDTGDYVIVVNADKVVVTAGKASKNFAYRHSGYPGGLRATSWATMLAEDPAELVERAVRGMLPKTRLGRAQMTKLYVYAGPDHPHAAQKPVAYDAASARA